MPGKGEVSIAGHNYTLLDQKLLSGNRRSYSVETRPSQPTDPFNLLFCEWQLHGPLGLSRESFRGGQLGHDYSEDLDTRWTDLLVPTAQKNTLNISGKDPIGATTSAALGGFALGAAPLGGGTSNYDPSQIEILNEQKGYLLASRRAFHTQVQVSGTDTLIETTTHGGTIKADVVWRGKGYLGFGQTAAVKSRTGLTSSGGTYTEETSVTIGTEGAGKTLYARALQTGNDRLWAARSDQAGSKENFAFYSVTDPDNADVTVWSNSFPIGDGKHGVNGIGTLGPFTIFGMTDGIYGFTDFGKPVKLLDLSQNDSTQNGKQFIEYRGWLYFITETGLKAWGGGRLISDVGIETLKDYEGAVNGVPKALGLIKDYFAASYRDSADNQSYTVLALPAPDHESTGRLEWYPHYLTTSNRKTLAMRGTNSPLVPSLYWGEGNRLVHSIFAKTSRDIDSSTYAYNNGAGTWYGTTMMRRPHMRKYLRWAKYVSENHDANDVSKLEVQWDDSGTWYQVGQSVLTNGLQTLRPMNGSQPWDVMNGTRCKPRITITPDSATSAPTTVPQIRGSLLMCFDERPDTVEEHTYVLAVTESEREALNALLKPSTSDVNDTVGLLPLALVEPGQRETAVNMRYAHVTSLAEERTTNPEITALSVTMVIWETDNAGT